MSGEMSRSDKRVWDSENLLPPRQKSHTRREQARALHGELNFLLPVKVRLHSESNLCSCRGGSLRPPARKLGFVIG